MTDLERTKVEVWRWASRVDWCVRVIVVVTAVVLHLPPLAAVAENLTALAITKVPAFVVGTWFLQRAARIRVTVTGTKVIVVNPTRVHALDRREVIAIEVDLKSRLTPGVAVVTASGQRVRCAALAPTIGLHTITGIGPAEQGRVRATACRLEMALNRPESR